MSAYIVHHQENDQHFNYSWPFTKWYVFQVDENNKAIMRTLNLNGHVGFDSMPDQLTHKSAQNGFVFNILCIGK